MCCMITFVAKILLTVLNTVFACLSLVMVGVGCALFYAGDLVIPFTNMLLEQLASRGVITQASLDVSGFDIASIATQLAWPMVMCGAVLFLISFVGCCGANCENKLLLFVYSVLLAVIIAAELLAVIVLAGGQETFKQQAIDQANNYVIDQYKGDNASDAFSVLMNIAQMGMHCCGITNYTILQQATNWNRTGTFYDQDGNEVSGTLLIPFSCCKMKEAFPSITPVATQCVTSLSTSSSYYDTSCYSKVESYINAYSVWAILGCLGFFGVQIAILVLAIFIIQGLSKPVNPA